MANHKSAVKRNKQSLVKRERNRAAKSNLRTVIKGFNTVVAKNPEEAKDLLAQALPVIAKAASHGIIHKKNASRKISRLTKKLQKAATPAQGS